MTTATIEQKRLTMNSALELITRNTKDGVQSLRSVSRFEQDNTSLEDLRRLDTFLSNSKVDEALELSRRLDCTMAKPIILTHLRKDIANRVQIDVLSEKYSGFELQKHEIIPIVAEQVLTSLNKGHSIYAARLVQHFDFSDTDTESFKSVAARSVEEFLVTGSQREAAIVAVSFHFTEKDLLACIDRLNGKVE